MNVVMKLLDGKKSVAGLALCAVSVIATWLNVHHVIAWVQPDWLMSVGQGLLGIGLIHKLEKLKSDIAPLQPLINQIAPVLSQIVPVVKQIATDVKTPIDNSKGGMTMKSILGLLLVSALLWLAIPAHADDVSTPSNPQVWFQGFGIQGWHILQRTDVDYLRGTTSNNDYIGAKCKFLSWPSDSIDLKYITLPEEFLSLNYGGITSHVGNGDFYGSISITPFQVATNGASFLSYISFGYLSDFRDHSNDEWIIGTSIPLGDMRKAITGLFGLN